MSNDFWKDYEPEPIRATLMTTDKALDLALEALESSVDLVREDAYNAEKLYGNYPTRQGKVRGLKVLADDHEKAITAIKQARALDKKAENARELGLDYEPHKGLSEHLAQVTNGRVWIDPVTGDVGIGTPEAQPAPVQEPVAWVCYGAPGKRDIDFEEADINKLPIGTQLYTTPPAAKREWTGLTKEKIKSLEKLAIDPVDANGWGVFNRERFAELIEAKLKEKNT